MKTMKKMSSDAKTFYFTVRGSNDVTPNAGRVTAQDQEEAEQKVYETYGFNPESETNPVVCEFVDEKVVQQIEQEKGLELTHVIE